MSKHVYIIGGAIVLASLLIGVFIGQRRCEKCPTKTELSDSAAYYRKTQDSLSMRIKDLQESITPVTNEPETIKLVVKRRIHLQRALGVDSSAAILWADPQ
jgi:hypothetical protein